MSRSIRHWALFIGAVILLTYCSALLWGRGGRGFFSPDTLEHRTQAELLLPLTDVPIYRSGYQVYRNEMVQFLIDENYWSPQHVDSPRWLPAFRWNDQWRDGYGELYREFTRDKNFWIEWTKQHREHSMAFWPEVLSLLRDSGERAATEAMHNLKYSLGDEPARAATAR